MSRLCPNTHTYLNALFAIVLSLTISGCANTGMFDRIGSGPTTSDQQQAIPDFVRNLPKSKTGNMPQYTVFGKSYQVLDTASNFSEEGIASWYGEKFHGRKTSSGEIYDMHAMTAAHKHLPLPTFVRVTNMENNRSVVVKVNDRGPFVGARIIDLSFAAAKELDMADQGTANVFVEALSTHLVAQNDLSNKSVAQSFGDIAREEKPAAAQDGASSDEIASEVVEPTLAAVPLQRSTDVIEQFERVVEPAAEGDLVLNTDLADTMDADGDGFVEIEKIGMTAYIEKDEKMELYRVKLGPFEKGDKLDDAMTELASIGIDGYTKLAAQR